jgi:hypothetical protein
MLRVVTDDDARAEMTVGLDEICREGARRMLAAALEAETDLYIEAVVDQRDERGRRVVVRNGRAEPRMITTSAGAIEIQAPRINDKRVDADTGERIRFRSSIVPPWCRKSPKVAEVLPLMYLHGLSTGDFVPALTEFFGSAAGLSSPVITRARQAVAGRTASLHEPRPVRVRLRVRVGRRVALQRAAPRRPTVLSGHRGCPSERQQRTDRYRRWLPGVHRILGRPAAGPETPRHASPDAGRR